jgi:type I restriction enzyme, S subunit
MTEIFEIITGKLDSNAAVEGGEYPFFTCAKEASQIDHFAFDCECLLLAGNNASGDFDVKYYNGKFNAYQRTYILTTDKINYDYAKFALNYQLKKLKQSSLGTNTRYLTMEIFKRMHIQIPSIDLQQQFSLYYNALKNSAGRDGFKVDELLKSTESLILMNH